MTTSPSQNGDDQSEPKPLRQASCWTRIGSRLMTKTRLRRRACGRRRAEHDNEKIRNEKQLKICT